MYFIIFKYIFICYDIYRRAFHLAISLLPNHYNNIVADANIIDSNVIYKINDMLNLANY